MTDKERIAVDTAIINLKNIRNNLPNVSSVDLVNKDFYLKMTWEHAMLALSALEKLTKP